MASSPDRALRLLSLDGGGVKGVTSLHILRHIFKEVERNVGHPVRPHEYFDLIGGTSTGGLIAIMFGVLHMSVDEAIRYYSKLAPKIFDKKWWTHTNTTKIIGAEYAHYWFRGKDLEDAVVDILDNLGLEPDKRLMDGSHQCRTFVTACNAHTGHTELLRTYPDTRTCGVDHNPTIVNAVRATSAAPPLFEPVTFSGSNRAKVSYVDGGLGKNNPIQEVVNESEHLWPNRDIGCLVSVGTGVLTIPGLRPEKSKLHDVLKACVHIATEADATARSYRQSRDGRKLLEGGKYFRYSVPQGITKEDTDNFKKVPFMEAVADSYAFDMDFEISKCAKELVNPQALDEDLKRRVSLPVPGEQVHGRLFTSPSMTRLHENGPDEPIVIPQPAPRPAARPMPQTVQSPLDSVTSFQSTSSERSQFDECMRRGDLNLKSPRTAGYSEKLEQALRDFLQALNILTREPVREPDRLRQVYKKLMDTKEMLSYSHRADLPERCAHLRQAQAYGSLMKESAQDHGDRCKLAQAEHSMACLKAREVELNGQEGLSLGPLFSKRDSVVEELKQKMDEVRRDPPPNLRDFEDRTNYWRDRIKNRLRINGHVELAADINLNKRNDFMA